MDDEIRYGEIKKVSIISIIGNVLLTIIKGVVGMFAGSTALLADAIHSASDLIGTIILLQGLKIAHLPPDESHPYGHHRAESITSKILAIILIVTALGIGYEAVKIIRVGEISPPGVIAIYTAILSIIVKEGMYQYGLAVGKRIKSNAVIADAWHHRSDAFSSVATLIGIAGALFGYTFMDPLAGIIVSLLILKTAVTIYIEAIKGLMDTAPDKDIIDAIEGAALNAEGVKSVQDVKVRQYGSKYFVDMKICVDPKITVEEGHGAAARAKVNVIKTNEDVKDVLIHVNPCLEKKEKHYCNDCEHNQR
ncbi:cation diffusion facilitator family transporter [Alkaliphilus peptidifermentans]|uniref:Cation diffusion facilitator family transporter n=1 Tax=Alkaliphilus peptidifermentans DSM 18978 TaxID=1120976 RepID=A0A1G5CSQ2_9FIRM|nr:cation diffusion facilitator family transporter [Alkaliphilus peptidifermentans]SCY05270.1 cation diffusion facilitator family transporter [Alkaliphilus peptidifermentans DSM 18978]